jgi:hypothetical protein
MEKTFDLRNGKTLNRKSVSFDGTLLSESTLVPLFGVKARFFLGGLSENSEYSKVKIDLSVIPDSMKLSLTNKRLCYIFVEETVTNYSSKSDSTTTFFRYNFHRIYNDNDIIKIQRCGNNMDFDNLIRNEVTKLSDNKFITYYIVNGFYTSGAVNHLAKGDTLGLVIDKPYGRFNTDRYTSEIVVESINYIEM